MKAEVEVEVLQVCGPLLMVIILQFPLGLYELQEYFYWPNLREDVGKYIRSCTTCAIAKLTIKKQGLYTPLPIPSRPWESISMDYMSGLPSTKHGNDCVFVVVDRFSKTAIMAAYKKNITAEATAKLFFERLWVHFGIP